MIRPKIAIHTDVVIEYLIHHGNRIPVLRIAMMKFFCYTTVFNAIELFSLARTDRERTAVAGALGAMKILGLNAKQAPKYGSWLAEYSRTKPMALLVAGICMESKLPLLTYDEKAFRGIRGLRLLRASLVKIENPAEKILTGGETL